MTPQLYWIPTNQPGLLATPVSPQWCPSWSQKKNPSWTSPTKDPPPKPIPDRDIPQSPASPLLGELAEQLQSGKSIAIHCRQGIGRSGIINAALLMHLGSTAEAAIAKVSVARGLAIPETPAEVHWLRQLSLRPLAIT